MTQAFCAAVNPPLTASRRASSRGQYISSWTFERWTAVTPDDSSLIASTGWARAASSAYFAGSSTSIAKTGATLTGTSLRTRRLALVATTCAGGGTVGLYWNGKLLKTIDLNVTTTTDKAVRGCGSVD